MLCPWNNDGQNVRRWAQVLKNIAVYRLYLHLEILSTTKWFFLSSRKDIILLQTTDMKSKALRRSATGEFQPTGMGTQIGHFLDHSVGSPRHFGGVQFCHRCLYKDTHRMFKRVVGETSNLQWSIIYEAVGVYNRKLHNKHFSVIKWDKKIVQVFVTMMLWCTEL